MIKVTRFDGSEFYINTDFIETIEATPDTVISLTTNKRLIVRESLETVLDRIVAYKRSLLRNQMASTDESIELPSRGIGSFDWLENDTTEDYSN